MPFAAPNKLDEENDPNHNSGQGGTNVSGQSTSFATNVPGQEPGGKPQQGSGQYTNIQSYIDANKPQAGEMGTQVANKITSVGQEARDQIGTTGQQFKNEVDQGSLQGMGTAQNEANTIVNQARSQNASQKLSDDQLNRFKDVSNATYKGPQDLETSDLYQPVSQKVQKTQQYSTMSESDPGRYQLLNEVFARPDYTAGQKSLDNLLISGDPGTKQKLEAARAGVTDVGGLLSQASDQAKALASQRSAEHDALKNAVLQGFTGSRDERSNEIENRLSDVKNHWSDDYNEYAKLLGDYKGGNLNVTSKQAKQLGMMNSPGAGLFNILNGVDPSSFLTLNAYDAKKVISKDEQAQLAALDQLGALGGLAHTNRYTNADDAGTLSLNNALDATRFGESARQADGAFKDFARDTNFTGYGSNTQHYDGGWLGGGSGDITSNARVSESLEKYLNGLATTAGADSNPSQNLNPLLLNPYTAIVPILAEAGIQLGPDVSGNANDAAHYWAKKYAAEDLYSKLMGALNDSGYQNRLTIDGQGADPIANMKGDKGSPIQLPNGTIINQKG